MRMARKNRNQHTLIGYVVFADSAAGGISRLYCREYAQSLLSNMRANGIVFTTLEGTQNVRFKD